MYIRNSRKACLVEKGLENFAFEYKPEIIRYKYAMGFKLSKADDASLEEKDKLNSYKDWERSIKKKYKDTDINVLREFSVYLRICEQIKNTSHTVEIMMATAIFSCLMSTVFNILFEFNDDTNSVVMGLLTPVSKYVWISVFIIMIILAVFGLFCIVEKIINPFWSEKIDSMFYKDYKEIIDKLISQKRGSKKGT